MNFRLREKYRSLGIGNIEKIQFYSKWEYMGRVVMGNRLEVERGL